MTLGIVAVRETELSREPPRTHPTIVTPLDAVLPVFATEGGFRFSNVFALPLFAGAFVQHSVFLFVAASFPFVLLVVTPGTFRIENRFSGFVVCF